MTINITELDRIVTFIEDHPEQHCQDVWICETGACLAGHVALQNGYRVVSDGFKGRRVECLDTGEHKWVSDVAVEILGLTEEESILLFAGHNTIENLRMMTKDIANGENLRETWDLPDAGLRATRKKESSA